MSEPPPWASLILAAQQQRHLAIGDRLLRQVVVENDRVAAVVAEELAHGAAGIGGEELERGRLGGGRRHHDRVIEGAVLLERLHQLGDTRALLADGDVDAIELLLLVARLVDVALVDDGVDGDRGLAGLAIADDELALAAPDGNETVDRLQAGLHRLVHRAARDDAGGLDLDPRHLGAGDRALAVDRVAERVHHAAQKRLADRHLHDGPRALDGVAFLDGAVVAEDHHAHVVGLEVERHALDAARELDHLAGLDLVEAPDPRDAVADRDDLADLGHVRLRIEIGDLLAQNGGDFRGPDFHQPIPFMASSRRCNLLRSELSTMREPSFTTSPPRRAGSTLKTRLTALPAALASWALSAATWEASSGAAERTSARSSPRRHHLGLIAPGDERALHEPAQLLAFRDHGLEGGEVGGHGVELLAVVGELIKCCGIASGNAG